MKQPTYKKIAVAGAGAVGSLLGGLLARAGHDVTLIGRKEHVEAINMTGLHIGELSKNFTVKVNADFRLRFRPDLVLLTVKMTDMETMCRQIAPHIKNVPVLVLQNGVRSDELAGNIFGDQNIIGAIALFNARFVQPGYVVRGSRGALLIGNTRQSETQQHFIKNYQLQEISDLFSPFIPTTLCDNIEGARWTKLLVNVLANSLDAMTGECLQTCMKNRHLRKIGTCILKEALMVIEKSQIRLASLPGIPVTPLRLIIKSPLPVASSALRYFTRKTDTISSTLQSLQRRKPTEIDYLNGEIVELGRIISSATPFNSKVVEIIRNIEKTHEFYLPSLLWNIFKKLQT